MATVVYNWATKLAPVNVANSISYVMSVNEVTLVRHLQEVALNAKYSTASFCGLAQDTLDSKACLR